MEEVQARSLDGHFVDAFQRSRIGVHLGAVSCQDLGEGGVGDVVGFEIHHGDAVRFHQGAVDDTLQEDLDRYNSFFSPSQAAEGDVLFTDLLVSWHIQEVVIPLTPVEDNGFDPMDETSEQLKDIVNKVA